ncbi:MAG: DNA repair protein RecN [Clostridia bacterium]|nr:DNA repair protein RecN [Clostridia bacterium]
MLTTLHIQNVGIINDLSIEFNEGFNILTGETGAGKTLLIGSLAILAGGRFSKEIIRKGEAFSFIEACFYVPQNQLAVDGNVIVSREIHENGRNSCKINGRLVTVSELKEFMSQIIDIHGQHDNQLLLNPATHIQYLDRFIGNTMIQQKQEYHVLLQQYRHIQKELKENYGEEQEKERRLDLLHYQLNEIDNAHLKESEETELEVKRKQIQNSEKLAQALNEIDSNLNDNAITAISSSIRNLEKIEDCGTIYQEKLSSLKSIYYDIQELARDFSSMKEDIYFDEGEQEQIEERLDTIFSLKRKYGNNISEILSYRNKVQEEIEKIENLDEYREELKQNLQAVEEKMKQLSTAMNELRKEASQQLTQQINKELKELEMPNAKFEVNIEQTEQFNENGKDEVEFMICTNIGDESKPLHKIASGGEMSRIMLAIKTVLTNVDEISTLIFDEIDTGISGKASKAVGEKLKLIAKTHQVLCITHQASIAAKGDYNYYISKQVNENQTHTVVKQLSEEEIIEEIARISSGDITDIAKAHAKELRKAS